MGCGCGGSQPTTQYEVTLGDGTKATFDTRPEADLYAARFGGGVVRPVSKAPAQV